jgi:hypothetical protein
MISKFVPLLIPLLLPLSALAGNGVSGGGRGVVCRNAQGDITSAELLDLWEARTLEGRSIPHSSQPVDAQVDAALHRLENAVYEVYIGLDGDRPSPARVFYGRLHLKAEPFLKNSTNLVRLRGIALNDTRDSDEPAVPAGCKVEQIVNYQDGATSRILLNQDIFDQLSPTDQAALIVHEALYAELRTYGETTSTRTRRAVGYVFAGESFPEFDYLIYHKRHVVCRAATGTPRTQLYVYARPDGSFTATLGFLDNHPSLGLFPASPDSERLLQGLLGGQLDTILGDDLCAAGSGLLQYPYYSVSLAGQGPADFQSQIWFTFACHEGKLSLSLDIGEDNNGTKEPLACRMVETSDPRQ